MPTDEVVRAVADRLRAFCEDAQIDPALVFIDGETVNGWQPMNTADAVKASRDYVLLLKPAWYHPPRMFISRWVDTGLTTGWEGYYGPEPTHWMPLPDPPKA